MNRRTRLTFLFLSLMTLLIVGYAATGSASFLLNQFWFTAGLFLLVLLSLIDQPHFSTDANIFINGATGWISLLLVESSGRDGIWWGFFVWASYLIISSYGLMWVRSKTLINENSITQTISRLNRNIGRPEAIFSAFFLWGCIRQFGIGSPKFDALLLFWTIFMIINLPGVANSLNSLWPKKKNESADRTLGVVTRVISPSIMDAELAAEGQEDIVTKKVCIESTNGRNAAYGIVIDDRTIAGKRIGKIAVTKKGPYWSDIADGTGKPVSIRIDGTDQEDKERPRPISVVDVGSEIGTLVLFLHPKQELQEGDVLWVQIGEMSKAFYQVIAAEITEIESIDKNRIQRVKVIAGQLGIWNPLNSGFEPITWVAPAGALVFHASSYVMPTPNISAERVIVGKIPNSQFPIHVDINDIVTHNAATIGVTGSGKSYLTMHLIEAMVRQKIKVLILDISRQHYLYLNHLKPTALKVVADVVPWLQSDSMIGIHQFALNNQSYPHVTSEFVEQAFKEVCKVTLQPGKNEPAKLCIVFEEAHSLIPEWQQVSDQNDKNHVNKTSRCILQGRKYGMGCIVITQRTANVTKTILNQCNTIFALQSFDQTGLDFLKNYMGADYAGALSTMPKYHTVLVGKASSSNRPVLFKIEDLDQRWQSTPASNGNVAEEAIAAKPKNEAISSGD